MGFFSHSSVLVLVFIERFGKEGLFKSHRRKFSFLFYSMGGRFKQHPIYFVSKSQWAHIKLGFIEKAEWFLKQIQGDFEMNSSLALLTKIYLK